MSFQRLRASPIKIRPERSHANAASLAGERIDTLLSTNALTRADFARLIGLTTMEVSRLIRGLKRINLPLSIRLAHFFGTTDDYWLALQHEQDLATLNPKYREAVERSIPTLAQALDLRAETP